MTEFGDNTLINQSEIDVDIRFRGKNSKVLIEERCSTLGLTVEVGDRCNIRIGSDCSLGLMNLYCNDDANIEIGNRFRCTYKVEIYSHESANITLSDDILCASNVLITASDMHGIFDKSAAERINGPKDIVIHEHVWLGADSVILKGSNIGTGSVVGIRSVVTGFIPENVVAAGTPAKPVRQNIVWRDGFTLEKEYLGLNR